MIRRLFLQSGKIGMLLSGNLFVEKRPSLLHVLRDIKGAQHKNIIDEQFTNWPY